MASAPCGIPEAKLPSKGFPPLGGNFERRIKRLGSYKLLGGNLNVGKFRER